MASITETHSEGGGEIYFLCFHGKTFLPLLTKVTDL